MKTLRPYDFFLGEDAPAYIQQTNAVMSVNLVNSPDCIVTAAIQASPDWSGDTVRVKMGVRNTTGTTGDTMIMRGRLTAWPSVSSTSGNFTGAYASTEIASYSGNPAIIGSEEIEVIVPAGYTPDQTLTLELSFDTDNSTSGIEPAIVLVEYKFA